MPLDDDTQQRLRELLRDTTALVRVGGQAAATAFFIGDDLLLTCGHVPHGPVEIEPYRRERRPAEIVHRDDDADLMLLRSPAEHDDPSPCVVLGRDTPDGADCIVAGYPRDDTGVLKPEAMRSPVHWRGDRESLVIEPGQIVTSGMSGGPVVSIANGAVVGIVRSSKHPKDALGGNAIPIRRAALVLPEVDDALHRETPCMIPWRDVLGPALWRRLDRNWHLESRVDLRVTGSLTHWEVSIEHAGKTFSTKDHDLGERVTEAIFSWAQRRHARRPDEVELLGQLLARALFPVDMPMWLKDVGRADTVIVRLHVTPGDNDLADIPWELTADPFSADRNRYLAADHRFVFTRVMGCGVDVSTAPEPKPAGDIRILTVVAQPEGWEHNDIPGAVPGGYHEWPDATEIRDGLEAAILDAGFRDITTLDPATSYGLHDYLETASPCDVLHYIGTGTLKNGRAQIVFMDAGGRANLKDVHDILATAAGAGVRLVLLELMTPPENGEFDQLTCHALDQAVQGTVTALVVTNLPVYPDQCETFNREFYRALGRGESVERAVQKARWTLQDSQPIGDAAGFGWFTLVTGHQADTCVVTPPLSRDPVQSGVRATGLRPTSRTGDVRYR